MTIENNIVTEAQRLFDVVGITTYSQGNLLILGIVTTPEKDLDEFLRDEGGVFRLRGFEVHAQPRIGALIRFIREQGLSAEIWGRCGYPQGEELNLKRQAVAAGLGKWGKNSLVLHPCFGPWLRLMAVRVMEAILSPTGPGRDSHEENLLCKDCTACVDACPLSILKPYYLQNHTSCLASITRLTQPGKLLACDRCLVVCPVGR